eukprot:TRINITY_DN35117_c0_g1_i1.p1 TRINITY_DN35117_c0_g1~~TRINITY_DN35117_c0_g1_i1.p1  ORF type:complete len:212 (+),score=20.92 TRINITY_DN35117_c0_g1_i1:142-777(+)
MVNFSQVLPDDTVLHGGRNKVSKVVVSNAKSAQASMFATNKGALGWLYEQAEQDESRFKRFLATRPRCERALRWCLREPLNRRGGEGAPDRERVVKLESALAMARQGVGPQAKLVEWGSRRLDRLRQLVEGGQTSKPGIGGDAQQGQCAHEDGFREEILPCGATVRVCDTCGLRIGSCPHEDGFREQVSEGVAIHVCDLCGASEATEPLKH